MMIGRCIYSPPELENDRANIQLYITPSNNGYTFYIQAVALNDGMFRIKIENIQHANVEKACKLVLNTLHMYWMPMYVYKDLIECLNGDDVEYSSELFNETLHTGPHRYDSMARITWPKGEIIVSNDGTLSFEWERPPHNMYDDGTNQASQANQATYDLYFKESIEYHRERKEEYPIAGFKYPYL